MNTCIQILNSETAQVLGPIFCPQCKLVDKEDALNTAQVHPCWNMFLKHAKYAQCAISPVWCFTRCKSPLTLSTLTTCVQILWLYKIYTTSLSITLLFYDIFRKKQIKRHITILQRNAIWLKLWVFYKSCVENRWGFINIFQIYKKISKTILWSKIVKFKDFKTQWPYLK